MGRYKGGSRVFVLLVFSPCTILECVVNATSRMFKPRERTLISILHEVVWASGLAWMCMKKLAPTGVRKQTVRSVTIRDPGRPKNVWLRERMMNLHFMQYSPHCYYILHPESHTFLSLFFLQGWNQVTCPFETPENDLAYFNRKCIWIDKGLRETLQVVTNNREIIFSNPIGFLFVLR